MNQVNKKKQYGLTLIELMVAVTIGLILMAGVMQIYLSNKNTYRVTEGLSRLQENGRFAIHFLVKDIRIAGYQGCKKRINSTINTAAIPAVYLFDEFSSINGIDSSDGGEDIDGGGDDISPLLGSDVLRIQTGRSCGILTAAMANKAASIQVTTTCEFNNNDFFIVSDCESSSIARITNVAPVVSPITHAALNRAYSAGSDFLKVESVSYFVANNLNGVPALMRRNNVDGTTEELVENVDDLQFEYGEDTNGNGTANRYIAAGSVSNMQNVVSIRMTVSVRTANDMLSQSSGPIPVGGTDNRIRKTYSTTIAIRN